MASDLTRHSALAMDATTFRALGHRLVDQVADLLNALPRGPVTRNESPSEVRAALGLTGPLPESGMDPLASSGTSPHRRRQLACSATSLQLR